MKNTILWYLRIIAQKQQSKIANSEIKESDYEQLLRITFDKKLDLKITYWGLMKKRKSKDLCTWSLIKLCWFCEIRNFSAFFISS